MKKSGSFLFHKHNYSGRIINGRKLNLFYSVFLMCLTLMATETQADILNDSYALAKTTATTRTIEWSGQTWNVKSGIKGPGPNNWSDDSSTVWVDPDGNLHLKIRQIGGKWYCAEIYSLLSPGYGEYTFQITTNVEKLDQNIVLGLYTYETDTKEIDIEFSRWSNPSNSAGWYIVQPPSPESRNSFPLNLKGSYSTHRFKWSPLEVYFQSFHGHNTTNLINQWSYKGLYNPPAGNEKVHLNLWLYRATPPSNLQEAEVVITSFSFKKLEPKIFATSPHGGENWVTGTTKNVTWTTTDLTGNVNVEINENYPTGTWRPLAMNTVNDGSLLYSVDGSAGTEKRIRVTSVNYPAVSDLSKSNFSFSAPSTTSSPTLLAALTDLANRCAWSGTGAGNALKNQYKNNQKVFAFLSNGNQQAGQTGIEILIDLADYYSAMMNADNHPENAITEEGRQGWITIWAKMKMGGNLDENLPINFGVTPPIPFTPPQFDTKKEWDFNALSLGLPFSKPSLIQKNETGWGILEKEDVLLTKSGTYLEDSGMNMIRFEIKREQLDELINASFAASLADGLMNIFSINNSAEIFISSIVDFDGEKIIPNPSLLSPEFRRFSSTDNNQTGVDGAINFLNGGADIDGDGIRDNYFPVIPETFTGLPLSTNQAELTFQNTGNEEADFFVRLTNVPNGWVIGNNDYGFHLLNDNCYDFPNVHPSEWNDYISSFWTIGCLTDAPDVANVTFELWQKGNQAGKSEIIQERTITLHKQSAASNTKPTFNALNPVYDASLSSDHNITIIWQDSDPDDNAAIALAIDPDLNTTPWIGNENHIWIAKEIQEDYGNTFTWNIAGYKHGTYSLWAVIFDGKNAPEYVKFSGKVTIRSQFDDISPLVEINTPDTLWFRSNPVLDIDFLDNLTLDSISYQISSADGLNKSTFYPLTSNGMTALSGSQNNLGDRLTTDWKISNADWDSLSVDSQIGEKYYLYFKVTDDAGNTYLTPDQTHAYEIKSDVQSPHLVINFPVDGQEFNTNAVEISWSADDVTSGLDKISIALDQSVNYILLNDSTRIYSFTNLNDGVHTVYLKATDKAGNFSDLKLVHFSVNSAISIPTLSGFSISTISTNSAFADGIVSDDQGVGITSKGFCWSTIANPTVELSTKTNDGAGSGIFSAILSGLTAGITYHVRAYATNCAGTAYSEDIQFTTNSLSVIPSLITIPVSDICLETVLSGGFITSDGDAAVLEKGVCWSTNPNPTLIDSTTIDGNGKGAFRSNVTGLTAGNTYYLRAYSTNTIGTGYGQEIEFTTPAAVILPIVYTTTLGSTEATTARIGGEITYNGGSSITSRGVCWSTSANPTIDSATKTTDGSGEGKFTSILSGLKPSTIYHVRAYATNSAGTAYGEEVVFTTRINDTPGCSFSATPVNDCTPLTVTFTDESTNTPTSWAWDIDNNGVIDYTTKNPTHTYNNAGTYSVKLTATNASGFTSKTLINYITVKPTIIPNIAITASPSATINNGQLVTFTATLTNGGTAPNYQWQVNGVHVGSNSPTYISTALTNEQIVACLMTTDVPCASASFVSSNAITINSRPSDAGTISGVTIVCQGQNSFTYNVPVITDATLYIWSLPSGATKLIPTNSMTVSYGDLAFSGNISVNGRNSSGDGAISTLAITVITPATPTITQENNILHSDAASGNQWFNQDGRINGATNQDFIPKSSGEYYVVVSANGCASNPSNSMHFIPTRIDRTKSGKSIKVYPNPVTNELIIEIEGDKIKSDFEVLNSIGQVVLSGILWRKNVLKTASLTPGIYLLVLESGETHEFRKANNN